MSTTEGLQIEKIVSVPFQENTFVVHLAGRDDCLVFDPGLEPQKIFDALDRLKLTPAAIVCTHGHSDHIGGNRALKDCWPEAPLVIGAGDAEKLTDPVKNLSARFGVDLISPEADQLLHEGDVFEAAGIRLEVLEIPGHSVGHIVFVYKEESPFQVFGGDVLFRGSIGRTDFSDGDTELLYQGIREKLFPLPHDTVVWPGHGPATTIGEEIRTNPYVGVPAGYRG